MTSTATATACLPGDNSLRGPFRLAVAMLVVTTVTIMKGAMTTSTGSGMAFLDWPLSDGHLMPVRSYTTLPGFFEHFHRLFGALAGLLSLCMAVWLHSRRLGDPVVRRTAWFGLSLIIVQGIFGGIGVLLELPLFTSATHGTLAQLTLATFAWIAYQLSDRYRVTQPLANVAPGKGRKVAIMGIVVLVVQTVLGAIARHGNSPHALWTHVGNAFVVFILMTIVTSFAVGKLGEAPGIKAHARILVSLLMLQIVLGFVALSIRNSAGKTPENVANLGTAAIISVHVLFGALLTVFAASLAAHVFRATRGTDARPAVFS